MEQIEANWKQLSSPRHFFSSHKMVKYSAFTDDLTLSCVETFSISDGSSSAYIYRDCDVFFWTDRNYQTFGQYASIPTA